MDDQVAWIIHHQWVLLIPTHRYKSMTNLYKYGYSRYDPVSSKKRKKKKRKKKLVQTNVCSFTLKLTRWSQVIFDVDKERKKSTERRCLRRMILASRLCTVQGGQGSSDPFPLTQQKDALANAHPSLLYLQHKHSIQECSARRLYWWYMWVIVLLSTTWHIQMTAIRINDHWRNKG